MNVESLGFRKKIGYSILGMLAVYFILGLWLTLSPRAMLINRKITNYYRWALLPGPFFREDRIHTPGHFYVSYKTARGDWSSFRNPEAEQIQQYRHSFFDYSSLQQARVSHFMARALYAAWKKRPETIVESGALRQMHAHLKRGYIPGDADSVKMRYLRRVTNDGMDPKDVYFEFTYPSF